MGSKAQLISNAIVKNASRTTNSLQQESGQEHEFIVAIQAFIAALADVTESTVDCRFIMVAEYNYPALRLVLSPSAHKRPPQEQEVTSHCMIWANDANERRPRDDRYKIAGLLMRVERLYLTTVTSFQSVDRDHPRPDVLSPTG
jgi:hypothetical protein